ncbi:MAG: hypothetical protein IKC63_08465 [Clostridia bacterium]|nr:hypothetical protein [Clostridia bacterium]
MKKTGVIYHNGYYRVARRLGVVRYLTLFVLMVFSLTLFFAFRQDMTLDHFRYLLRNFDFTPNASSTSGDTIHYNGDPDATFGFVSGGFATVTDTRVFVTDRSSSTTFSAYHGYREPRGVFSDTYMLLYDRGGSELSVYNAFSLIKSFSYEGTVIAAAAADDGTFAVAVTPSDGYYSVVYVYDRQMKCVNTISKYKYLTSLSLSRDGSTLLVGSRYPSESGAEAYELLTLEVGSKTPTVSLTLSKTVYAAALSGSGGIMVLTEDEVQFYAEDGSLLSAFATEGAPRKSSFTKEGVLLVTSGADGREERLAYVTPAGKTLYSLPCRAVSFGEDDKRLYCLLENSLAVIDKETGVFTETAVDVSEAIALVNDVERVYLASADLAERLDHKALGEKNSQTDTER